MDRVADLLGIELKKPFFKRYLTGRVAQDNGYLYLAKPLTYMNRSGDVFPALLSRTRVRLEDTLVICDNLDLNVGMARLKLKGSSAGHNGLKSIMDALGHGTFMRLYLGIGRPNGRDTVVDHVLGKPSKQEIPHYEKMVERAADVVLQLATRSATEVMNELNRKQEDGL